MASILDPFGSATHTALSFALVGEDVLITGAGPIGIMAAAVARHVGARHIVVTDINPDRLALAEKVTSVETVNVATQDLNDTIAQLKMKQGFDVGLEMSGNQRALDQMVEAMTMGGKIAMLGIPPGKPELPLPGEAIEGALGLAAREGMTRDALVIGLNTGAGGRWTSKGLPPDRVVGFAGAFATASGRDVTFLVLGGPPERARNGAIIAGIGATPVPGIRVVDGGTDNDIATFAAIVGLCDLLVTSDSLALHLGGAMDVPTVAFFAPTSAAEIELYGLGEKVVSTAPDYCSYAKDADNSTITIEQ